jgi:hypothetical protein
MHGVICPGLPVSMITIIKWELEARSMYKAGLFFQDRKVKKIPDCILWT